MKKVRRGMNIPSEYPVGGNKITVELNRDLLEEYEVMGFYEPYQNLMMLQAPVKDGYSKEIVEETWCHEVIHTWADKLDYPKLFKNEKFTNDFGGALLQLLKAMGVF